MTQQAKSLIDKLATANTLEPAEFLYLLQNISQETADYLFAKARQTAKAHFGNQIYTRGLIEFSNYCKNDCYYCGIRRSNPKAVRYRLSKDEILACCETGYGLGFRTFVLQGGEDGYFTDDRLVDIIQAIKDGYDDCAITLSLGERSRESYQRLYEAGGDRYLLRHETASPDHYAQLHPKELTLASRMQCLADLKTVGFQVGVGFMVGSPGQNLDNLVADLLFIHDFKPQMVGLGPFIPHVDTQFASMPQGSLETTLFLLGLIRLMLPNVLLPATTALGTIDGQGRELGILAGANVVMPNLSPVTHRKDYALYDNKICTGEEAAECRGCLQNRMSAIGYELAVDRGDYQLI